MKIACDVDDILFEFYEALAEFHNRVYGGALCKESFTSYFVHEVWGGGVDESVSKVWTFYGSDSFLRMPLVAGAVNAIRRLAEVCEIEAVTGRPHGVAPLTKHMLDEHFVGCFLGIHHTDAFIIGQGVSRPKLDVCKEIGASVLIEDYLGHAIPCAEAGIHVILFDQPWNRESVVCGGRIDRVHSWDEALALLL